MRKTILRGAAALLLFGGGVFYAGDASAQPSQRDRELAESKFKQAEALYRVQEYEQALALYKESYLLSLEPTLLFNMGQCYRQLKKYDEAIKAYKSYIRDEPKAPKAEIERIIKEVEDLIEKEKSIGKLPPTGTNPNEGNGEPKSNPALNPNPNPDPNPNPTTQPTSDGPGLNPTAKLLYFGAAGAAGAGAILGGVALASSAGVKNLQAEGAASADEITSGFGRAKALAAASDALFVVAVGAGAAGFFLQKSYQQKREAALSLGPTGATLRVRF